MDFLRALYSALRYFLLANAVRDINGDLTAHRSMLVNVSRFTKVQEQISKLIVEWLYEVQRDVRNYCKLDEEQSLQKQAALQH